MTLAERRFVQGSGDGYEAAAPEAKTACRLPPAELSVPFGQSSIFQSPHFTMLKSQIGWAVNSADSRSTGWASSVVIIGHCETCSSIVRRDTFPRQSSFVFGRRTGDV